jgi:hypothetical protein
MFKILRRGQTVTDQKQDSNSWTVIVQMFVDEDFDCLTGKTGFSFIQITCNFMS